MADGPLRKVTRGYVWALIIAISIFATALLVASWGVISLSSDKPPVSTENEPYGIAIAIVFVNLIIFAWSQWIEALEILRGRKSLSWSRVLMIALAGYLIWSIVGTIVGLSLEDTFLSAYAISLAIIWAISAIVFWAILVRRVYTERGVPKWPWERRGDVGPDWIDEDPFGEGADSGNGDQR